MAVSINLIYSLEEFKDAAGLTASSLRSALQSRLRAFQVGKRKYIRGADWEDFLLRQNGRTPSSPSVKGGA